MATLDEMYANYLGSAGGKAQAKAAASGGGSTSEGSASEDATGAEVSHNDYAAKKKKDPSLLAKLAASTPMGVMGAAAGNALRQAMNKAAVTSANVGDHGEAAQAAAPGAAEPDTVEPNPATTRGTAEGGAEAKDLGLGTMGAAAVQDPAAAAANVHLNPSEAMNDNAKGEAIGSSDAFSENAGEGSADAKALKAAETAAFGAQNRAMGAAQAAGLSAAAGANAGAQAGTEAYTSTYPQMALGFGQQDVSKWIASLDAQTQLKLKEMGIDLEKLKADQEAGGTMWQTAAQIIPWALAFLTSDRNAKTDIHDSEGVLEAVAKSVRGKSFKYKSSPERAEVGVMAQDLEKTPLATTVVDTPGGKMVDTRRLTTANTAMISELSRKLDKALKYIGGSK